MKEPSKVGKVAHNLGMSAWFGGTLFGQVSLNPTVSSHTFLLQEAKATLQHGPTLAIRSRYLTSKVPPNLPSAPLIAR